MKQRKRAFALVRSGDTSITSCNWKWSKRNLLSAFTNDDTTPFNWTISSPGESLAKSIEVKTFQPRFSTINTAKKYNRSVVVKQIYNLLVQTFIEIISVHVLQLANRLNISGLICHGLQLCNFRLEFFNLFICHPLRLRLFQQFCSTNLWAEIFSNGERNLYRRTTEVPRIDGKFSMTIRLHVSYMWGAQTPLNAEVNFHTQSNLFSHS